MATPDGGRTSIGRNRGRLELTMSSRLTGPSWTVATGAGIRFPSMDRIMKEHSRSWLAKQFVQIEAALRAGIMIDQQGATP